MAGKSRFSPLFCYPFVLLNMYILRRGGCGEASTAAGHLSEEMANGTKPRLLHPRVEAQEETRTIILRCTR